MKYRLVIVGTWLSERCVVRLWHCGRRRRPECMWMYFFECDYLFKFAVDCFPDDAVCSFA